ncbi:MAG: hypothetical protein KBS95_04385 [Alistipes sp.]|nr:hypothetical protein [Candidatus Alistipes equi]
MKASDFTAYIPSVNSASSVPDACGNYIIVLKDSAKLPDIGVKPVFKKFNGNDVIYTGIAGTSLRSRDVRTHFCGNAGRSTLRKSLGCLFGYEFVPRDAKDPNNGKVKFCDEDEEKLSAWMKKNLILYYNVNKEFEKHELELIEQYNPPLNLKDNNSDINAKYREQLSKLRARKPNLKKQLAKAKPNAKKTTSNSSYKAKNVTYFTNPDGKRIPKSVIDILTRKPEPIDPFLKERLEKERTEGLREEKIDEIGWKVLGFILLFGFISWIIFGISTCSSSNEGTGHRHYPSVEEREDYQEYLRQVEERKKTLDSYTPPADGAERFRRTLREGSKENRLIEKFDRGDYKDYYEYHDGPEGNIGDVDYHEIEDYFGGGRD